MKHDDNSPKESNFDPVLDAKLRNWGTFLFDLFHNRIGWSNQSPMVIALEVGVFTPTFGSKSPFLNDEAMEINTLVMMMLKNFPKQAEALLLYYYYPQEPLRALAAPLKVTVRTLRRRVYDAKVWLSGAMDRMKLEEQRKLSELEKRRRVS